MTISAVSTIRNTRTVSSLVAHTSHAIFKIGMHLVFGRPVDSPVSGQDPFELVIQ